MALSLSEGTNNISYKEKLRNYYKQFKKENRQIKFWLEYISQQQKKILDSFNINNIKIKDYDLPFRKNEFVNNIASLFYKGKVGRRFDKIIYYKNIPLAYIQLSSPVMNAKINKFLKEKYGNFDFKFLNKKVVELSICIAFGYLTKYLTGKLAVFTAMSKEVIEEYNQKYNTDIEVLFTTSIYGKSSLYNRVRNLQYLGLTEGYHSILTEEQIKEIKEKYKKYFPHRKIKKTSQADHLIRLYDHLQKAGISLSFRIEKHKRGVYLCTTFLSLKENLIYWYNRWFIPRRERLKIHIDNS